MTDIDLSTHSPVQSKTRSRESVLQEIVDSLNSFSDALYWNTIELAVSDALRAQAPADPDDLPPAIDPSVLADCGDGAVRELTELMVQVDHLVRTLK